MPSVFSFANMILRQQLGSQVLGRVEEPRSVTDAVENVAQYDQVMGTKLVLAYAAGLATIHRARGTDAATLAVDIACGPGHFTLCLARYLDFLRVIGVDLSEPMVETATANARKQNLHERVSFQTGDATRLDQLATHSCDLATFTDAAHHLPDLETVRAVLRELDRVTSPHGLVMVMDLARLRTAELTELYVNALGHDYIERGLPAFFDDFRNSMYAAWTTRELREAIPRDSQRWWCHLVPRGLPTVQIVLGLPVGRRRPFVRSGAAWSRDHHPVAPDMRGDWRMLQATLLLAGRSYVGPGG